MLKIRNYIIIIVVYIIAFVSLKFSIDLLYPYHLIKDLVMYPLNVLANDNRVVYTDTYVNNLTSELKREIEELKKLNGLTLVLSDYQTIKATVIVRNRSYWFNTITINKGTNDSVELDMAVVNNTGLIGRISKVTKNSSEIKLLTTNDLNSRISVVIHCDNKKIYGVMNGYDSINNNLLVTIPDKNISNITNSIVKTTGMGGVFPSGIIIGTVNSFLQDENGLGTIIKVMPVIDFNDLRYVSILKRN